MLISTNLSLETIASVFICSITFWGVEDVESLIISNWPVSPSHKPSEERYFPLIPGRETLSTVKRIECFPEVIDISTVESITLPETTPDLTQEKLVKINTPLRFSLLCINVPDIEPPWTPLLLAQVPFQFPVILTPEAYEGFVNPANINNKVSNSIFSFID